MPTPVVIDCDPGHDDAFALLLAVGSDSLDLRAVTTVAGNQSLEKATRNARNILSLAKKSDVPVAAGHTGPLLRIDNEGKQGDVFAGPDVHGQTGLDGWDFGEPAVPQAPEHAVALLTASLSEASEPVTIICLGPQTNVAAALLAAPHLHSSIREIVCMAGSTHRGNFLPYSEANVLFDPEAADVVARSGIPLTYVGLNVTHQALVTPEVLAEVAAVPRIGEAAEALLRFRTATYRRIWNMAAAPLHDPVAVAAVIDPTLLHCQDANVAIELRGEYTRGATVIDLLGLTSRPVNARVALDLDATRFWDMLATALRMLA